MKDLTKLTDAIVQLLARVKADAAARSDAIEQRLALLEARQDEQRLARIERSLRAFRLDADDHDDSHGVIQ